MIKVPPSTEIDETLRYIIITVNTRQIVQKMMEISFIFITITHCVHYLYLNLLQWPDFFFRNGHSLSLLQKECSFMILAEEINLWRIFLLYSFSVKEIIRLIRVYMNVRFKVCCIIIKIILCQQQKNFCYNGRN